MGKAPASQFYWGDLKRDVEYHLMSFEARGIWVEMLTCMWDARERGKIEGTLENLAGLLGCPQDRLQKAIEEVNVTKTGDVTNRNGNVTIINRRMFREEKQKESIRYRVRKYREKTIVTPKYSNVTPQSSSSSSSSKNINIPDSVFLSSLKEKYYWINFDQTMIKIDAWLSVHPERKKTRRFIINWLNKIERPMAISTPPKKEPPPPEIIPKDFVPDPQGKERLEGIIKSLSKEKELPTHNFDSERRRSELQLQANQLGVK